MSKDTDPAPGSFKILDSMGDWDFSDCQSTEDVRNAMADHIDSMFRHVAPPDVTFIDEAGEEKAACFCSLEGVVIT